MAALASLFQQSIPIYIGFYALARHASAHKSLIENFMNNGLYFCILKMIISCVRGHDIKKHETKTVQQLHETKCFNVSMFKCRSASNLLWLCCMDANPVAVP